MFEPAPRSMPPRTIVLAVLAVACLIAGFAGILLRKVTFPVGLTVLLVGGALVVLVAVLEYRRAPEQFRPPIHATALQLFTDLKQLATVIFVRSMRLVLRSRIGADSAHLLYDPGNGTVQRYAWSPVLTDRTDLLLGRRIVRLSTALAGEKPLTIFPSEPLRGLILARIPPSGIVKGWQLQWMALKRGNLALWAGLTLFVVALACMVLKETHPEISEVLREALKRWLT